jgi:hypothetical protein
VEGHGASERDLLRPFARLTPRFGVWAVAGNHEHYGGGSLALGALERQGVRVLQNEWREVAPGLIVAGVDGGRDRAGGRGGPASARDSGPDPGRLARALAGRPPGAPVILVSHEPVRVEEAARAGVGLMLSGHTHDGQLWPYRYVVRTQTPYLSGEFDVEGMRLIVCRGTGTFGPRMRLWRPSEIVRITLRAKPTGPS